LRVEKSIHLEMGSANLRVEWAFKAGSAPAAFRFASESLFCLLAGNAHDRYIEWDGSNGSTGPQGAGKDILASRGEMPGTSKVSLTDEWLKLRCEVRAAGSASAWRDALETVSQSEGGYERVYQGTAVLPVWDFELAPGAEAKASMSIQIREGA
jgi:alpha-amylase